MRAAQRTGLAGADPLKTFYRERYQSLLTRSGATALVRWLGWSGHEASFDTLLTQSSALHGLLVDSETDLFTPLANIDYPTFANSTAARC